MSGRWVGQCVWQRCGTTHAPGNSMPHPSMDQPQLPHPSTRACCSARLKLALARSSRCAARWHSSVATASCTTNSRACFQCSTAGLWIMPAVERRLWPRAPSPSTCPPPAAVRGPRAETAGNAGAEPGAAPGVRRQDAARQAVSLWHARRACLPLQLPPAAAAPPPAAGLAFAALRHAEGWAAVHLKHILPWLPWLAHPPAPARRQTFRRPPARWAGRPPPGRSAAA